MKKLPWMMWLTLIFPLALLGNARFSVPFDGSGTVADNTGKTLPEILIHGRNTYVSGMSGQALAVRRHAYDQVTAVQLSKLPFTSLRSGTVSFFYRPLGNESMGKPDRTLYRAVGSDFTAYLIYFADRGALELSVMMPSQRQLLVNQRLKAGKWYHFAFTWDAPEGAMALYIDGKLVKSASRPEWQRPEFNPKTAVDIWLGKGGADRFSAEVGEGDYDELRFHERALTANEVFAETLSSTSVSLVPVARKWVNALPQGGVSLRFKAQAERFNEMRPLVRLHGAAGQEITVSSMGGSGKLAISEKGGKTLSSPYVFDLSQPLSIGLMPQGERGLEILFDGASQGLLECPGPWTGLKSVEALSELTFCKDSVDEAALAALTRGTTSDLERRLWQLDDAWSNVAGVREMVSLNGVWRTSVGPTYSYAPHMGTPQHYSRVPGSFRSSWFSHYVERQGQLAALPTELAGKDTAGWYQRTFVLPAAWQGRRIWLHFDNLNADYGRIYVNGRLVDSFQQHFRHCLAIPNERSVDITDMVKPTGENVLTVFLDRFVRGGLWNGNVATFKDDAFLAIDNVSLETTPGQVRLHRAVVLPSFRKREATFRVVVHNPAGVRGRSRVSFTFEHGEDRRHFEEHFDLTGEREQRVIFVRRWKNPVLWNCESPRLYRQQVQLEVGGARADTMPERKFGFREAWVEDGEFWLNGLKTRYRMKTNPGIETLYLAHPRAMAQYVSTVKSYNYDTVRFNPNMMMGNSTINYREYLEECERQGLYNLFPLPFYEDDELGLYHENVEKFLEYYGRYANIIMWYTDFNTCHYQRNQDPYYLNDTSYCPTHVLAPRRRAMVAEKAIRELDHTREVFQHAGGNSGKIFTSMNYQSYGTPLQEQEDWPKIWAEKHTQPLMVVESGFPYPYQFFYFDGPKGHWLFAENASRFFGDDVYRAEHKPHVFNHSQYGTTRFGHIWKNAERVSIEHYRRVIRAWRGYGVSAVGDFTNMFEFHELHGAQPWHNRVFWGADNQVKSPGVRPDTGIFGHRMQSFLNPLPIVDVVRQEFAPLRVFLAGPPENFTNKDHAFTSGETLRRGVVLLNDRTVRETLQLRWRFVVDGETMQRGKKTMTLQPGDLQKFPLTFEAPCVAKRTPGKILLEVYRNGAAFDTDEYDVEIFPVRERPDFSQVEPAALYDPAGKTTALLERAGYPFRKVQSLDELKQHRLLIIGQDALGQLVPDFLRQLEECGELALGYKVLVFEQQPCNLGNLVYESPSYREAFIRQPRSPYLRGLCDADFRNWRGSSDTRPEKLVSEEKTRHYPRSKWKIGNGGMVAGNVIRKPSNGTFDTLVDCGPNLMFAALLEARRQHGHLLLCQLDVTCRYGKDPVATLLVDNMLTEMSKPLYPAPLGRTVYFGDERNEKRLRELGVAYRKGQTAGDLSGMDVVILGAQPVAEKEMARFGAELRKLLGRPSIVCLPGAPLELLQLPLKLSQTTGFKATLPDIPDPMFRGITEADLYYRWARKLTVVEGPSWLSATSPAIFAKYDVFPDAKGTHTGGVVAILTLAPDEFDDLQWNREKVTRVWNAILRNLNVETGCQQRFFSNFKLRHNTVTPSMGRIELKEGDIQFDPQNLGRVDEKAGFKPLKLGVSWEKQGYTQINKHYVYPKNAPDKLKNMYDGHAWIRVRVKVPGAWRGQAVRLIGGPIDDADKTWFNGHLIGEMPLDKFPNAYATPRNYRIPESAIRFDADNELLIQVFDRWGEGGVCGPLFLVIEDERTENSWSPYIEKLNFYDVDAFHNW